MSDTHTKAGPISRSRKLLYALVVLLLLAAALEAAFRAMGLFAPADPFIVFRDGQGREMVRYQWSGLKPEFCRDKAPGAFRIIIAGGSTALGFPFHPRSSFGQRLQWLLEDSLPGLEVEVINLGRMGMNAAEVKEAVSAALAFQPDLVVVYSGQNEFISLLRKTPVINLLGQERPRGLARLRLA